jgi:hypothetical protein
MMRFKIISLLLLFVSVKLSGQHIPLAEHPRPDFERSEWSNLNGSWDFAFDATNEGVSGGWANQPNVFNIKITVPFPWGSKLSGLDDEADIGWYRREITIDRSWEGKRIFLVIGASDWETSVWLDGHLLGTHRGGYLPIEVELTDYVKFGSAQSLVIRADDARRDFTLYGKQGYGNARGIWQTVYLETRGAEYLDAVHFTPDIDNNTVVATAFLPEPYSTNQTVSVSISDGKAKVASAEISFPAGQTRASVAIPLKNPRLWNLEDPFLYEAEVRMGRDTIHSYFGMRKISVMDLPGTDFPYIALNNKPIYLQLALDQSYHPDGFYTFPSDDFMREEIERSKSIGLNGIRTHIKIDIPRKLYWADKLGLLVMSDLPNSWGHPEQEMQEESEKTLRGMIKRDFNHPAVFSWIVFNETWGLTRNGEYGKDTQQWVASMYYLTKSLDSTRLVEDNSICCGRGHTITDINSWHSYLPGYGWEDYLKELTEKTFPGSDHHFEDGFLQGRQPNINSECGNVWGYDGSTGDVDWSWDYHKMLNTFRKYPKVAGWLYTEHHDVINEWNGYWRFDRSPKTTGIELLVPGMSLNDLHAGVYLSNGMEISREVRGGEKVSVPLFLSDMTGKALGSELEIAYSFTLTDDLGNTLSGPVGTLKVPFRPWMQETLKPLEITVPNREGVGLLSFEVRQGNGSVLSRNFMFFIVHSDAPVKGISRVSAKPQEYTSASWSDRTWEVLEGKKVNGAGSGYFEYQFELPATVSEANAGKVYFLAELSAKELFVKDREVYESDQDFMLGSRVAPSSNPNSYPMTDETFFSSTVQVSANGEALTSVTLEDDPADHRGVLSWHYQLRDGKLREAGSYGYLVKVPIPEAEVLKALNSNRMVNIRLASENGGGIAVYGRQFGRYSFDPGLVIEQ